jgi:LuxR family transcriptional regulator, maltose regulon positive regulatory protein
MPTPILATKLYVPPLRPKLVSRPHLLERLNEGLHNKLTLISAPAGFGKTTLVSEWVADSERPAAWLSLDDGDNDPARFLAYFVAALQTIAPNVGGSVLGVLQSPQPPPTESILTALLNEITTIQNSFILVLDDYHVIEARAVDTALTFLLEHLPTQMHLVIATREDPDLPLARWRVGGRLTELRAADLRFTLPEVSGLLSHVMGFQLSVEDIAALESRTEGWIASLQLAAISMQGHQNASSFIKSFTGSHHFVMDYLVEEVLQQQSEAIQTFLLRTSILDRLCGPLCEAVGGPGGRWVGPLASALKATLLSPFVSQKLVVMMASAKKEDLILLKELIEANKVTPVIDSCYSLTEAPEAIGYLEKGHARGKVVITMEPGNKT